MEDINILFQIISCLLAALAAGLLIWVNRERPHSNRILAMILIFFAFQNLMLFLLFSRSILDFPWLLRVFAPTTFLIAPAAYLYTRAVVNDELSFKPRDWLLLIPALLTIVNFLPVYSLSTAEKLEVLQKSFYDNRIHPDSGSGYISGRIYYVIRICWSLTFIIGSFRQIVLFNKRMPIGLQQKNSVLIRWLFRFNVLISAVLLTAVIKYLAPPIGSTPLTIADVLLGVTVFFVCIQLFVTPQILYGVFRPLELLSQGSDSDLDLITKNIPDKEEEMKSAGFSSFEVLDQQKQLELKTTIENHFEHAKPFLNPDYSLEHLVRDVRQPRYLLSAFINGEYGMGIKEFINRYRIAYFKEHCHTEEWQQLTLEAMARKCGFTNRVTFIRNFKIITGTTPSMYLRGHGFDSSSVR